MLTVLSFSLLVGMALGLRCPVMILLPATASLVLAKMIWLGGILTVSGLVSLLASLLSLQFGYAISTFAPLLACGRGSNNRTYRSEHL
ncbi:hypothetical protein FIU28_16960 [Tardiphaga sp. vice154]|uniref:hypothetical protein n=1 Tax=Tardiphaga sp. vice154 TaxID=2592814 RepID=UPI001164C8F2|nr:hypothetical protein [Tardiphaga sp. vice154]QDM22651.1 hypothetical protein FIU28_16960 [Tardiphaga sp. vice154]